MPFVKRSPDNQICVNKLLDVLYGKISLITTVVAHREMFGSQAMNTTRDLVWQREGSLDQFFGKTI